MLSMKKIWLFVFLASLFLTSCTATFLKFGLKQLGAYDSKVRYSTYVNKNKTIIIIPNIHLAIEEQFENLEFRLDSLFHRNYFLYYESIIGSAYDTVNLIKSNKLIGVEAANKDYKEIIEKFISKNNKKASKLIMQPKFHLMGANDQNSKNMDMSLAQIVEAYELKYGSIELNECDYLKFKSPETKCKPSPKLPSKQTNEFTVDERDKYIISEILKEDKSKIVMVYGKGHYPGMHKLLVQNGFTIIDSLKQ